MQQKGITLQNDLSAENAIISSVFKGGEEIFWELQPIIVEPRTFTSNDNGVLWNIYEKAFVSHKQKTIDVPSIFSIAKEQGLDSWVGRETFQKHLDTIINLPCDPANALPKSKKIRRLYVCRMAQECIANIGNDLEVITGDEPISQIFSILEKPIFELAGKINSVEREPVMMGNAVEEYLKARTENAGEDIGVSTMMPIYDWAIGGGLRPGALDVIAARAKQNKSSLAMNQAIHFAKMGLKVLYVDTELSLDDQMSRVLSSQTGVKMRSIENGGYAANENDSRLIENEAAVLKEIPIYHLDVSQVPSFEEQISIMNRWVRKVPGVNFDNTSNPCVVIYDYIKLLNKDQLSRNVAEYQQIGYMVSQLKNFAQKYSLPILALAQLNRSGISDQTSASISQSDRILWFASSVSTLAKKTPEEIESDGPENGTHKLYVSDARHGPGTPFGSHINLEIQQDSFKMKEVGMNVAEENSDPKSKSKKQEKVTEIEF